VARSLQFIVVDRRLSPAEHEGELMRHVLSACLFAICFAAAAADAIAQVSTVTTDTKVKSDNGKVVTMVGCVMIGGGTSFTLSNITSEREDHGRAAKRPRGPYALIPREGLDLGPYINQKVQLTGVVVLPAAKGDRDDKIEIEETTRTAVANGADRTSTAETTVKVARGPMNQFLVASVSSLAPSCE
jgi:hypothetical protein